MAAKRIQFLRQILTISFIMAVFYISVLKFHLQWTNHWIDIPSHLLGGADTTLIVWAYGFYVWKKSFFYAERLTTLAAALIVGFLWEVFEAHFHISSPLAVGYWRDTFSDLVCDVIGAFFAYYYFVKPRIDKIRES